MATQVEVRYLTVDEFLAIDFGPDLKAELDNGVIRMMGGRSLEHARIQMNLYRWFGDKLRGSGCRPFGSDAGVQTAGGSVRYPDLTVDCAPDEGAEREASRIVLKAPRMIVEILSPGTRAIDEGIKLTEYRQLEGLQIILFIDPLARRLRVLERDAATGRWSDRTHVDVVDVPLAPFGLALPHDEIFARD